MITNCWGPQKLTYRKTAKRIYGSENRGWIPQELGARALEYTGDQVMKGGRMAVAGVKCSYLKTSSVLALWL